MRYLLDTNVCIHAMRGHGAVVKAIAAQSPQDLGVSSITYYELFTGIEKCANSERERVKVETFIGALRHVAFDSSAAIHAARVRARLEASGQMIGPYDILIAGQALSLGAVLATANADEFSRVSGLVVENWSIDSP